VIHPGSPLSLKSQARRAAEFLYDDITAAFLLK
jgi:hypothetical protein